MRRVLVTGAGTGLGKAIAIDLAKLGFNVTLHYRSSSNGALEALDTIKSSGGEGSLISFDISDRNAVKEALEKDVEQNGAYYGVVCNAGLTADAAFPMMSDDDWDKVIHTNLDGFYNVLKPLVMPMIVSRSQSRSAPGFCKNNWISSAVFPEISAFSTGSGS